MVEEVLSLLEWGVLPTPAPRLASAKLPIPPSRGLEPHCSTCSLHWQAVSDRSVLVPQRYGRRGYFCIISGGLVSKMLGHGLLTLTLNACCDSAI